MLYDKSLEIQGFFYALNFKKTLKYNISDFIYLRIFSQ